MKKRLILLAVFMLTLLGIVVSGTVFAKYQSGSSADLPLRIRIRTVGIPEGADYVYDGQPHGISFETSLITVSGAPEGTEAGTYTAVFSLKDPVTECWKDGTREPKTAVLKIVRRPVVLTAQSEVKPWDGTPLTNYNYSIAPGRLPEGRFMNVPEGAEMLEEALAPGEKVDLVTFTGAQTDAGSSDNEISDAFIVNGSGTDVTANYDIRYVFGKLTVEPLPIDLPEDAVYKWDGSEHSIGFEAIASALQEVSVAGYQVLDANGRDVTSANPCGVYLDRAAGKKLFGTGTWNQTWIFRMALQPDVNHYWSVPLHGEVRDRRTVTLTILPELGNAKDVIIAAEDCSMVDGFTASGLAGLLNAPIISVRRGPSTLSEEELAKIARITSPSGARLWIMGGKLAVSLGIESDLRNRIGDPVLHITSVQRISGKERYSTAWHIFEAGHGSSRITEAEWNASGTVIILPGENVEPTLSIMTYAYASRTPVLLAKKGVLSNFFKDTDGDNVYETEISVEQLLSEARFKKAILIGPSSGSGNTYISEACEAQLRAAVPSVQIMRISGSSIGAMTNALCTWMESSTSAGCTDPNVLRSGAYTYIAPEASPRMKDSGRVVSISDYAGLFHEIDVLGDAHLYARTSANLPNRYTLTMTDGDQEGDPVLQGFTADDSITEVFFGSSSGSALQTFRPTAPEGYVFIGFGAPWRGGKHSYSDGVLSMTLRDSYLGAIPGNTRQAMLYALYVEKGKNPNDWSNRRRYQGVNSGGSYRKSLVEATDYRLIIPAD